MRLIRFQGIAERAKQLRTLTNPLKKIPSFLRVLPGVLWRRFVWSVIPKRRKIQALLTHQKMRPEIAEAMQQLWRDVYRTSLLEIKNQEQRLEVPLILSNTSQPTGPEQIFLLAIYPLLLHRRLIAIPRSSAPGRLEMEIGYRGHADEYYFWTFVIDGKSKDRADRVPTPRIRTREDRVYLSYPIPAAGLIDDQHWDPEATIIRSRSYLINILEDLKQRGYQLVTVRPHTHEVLTYNQRKAANSRVLSPFVIKRSGRR